MPLMSVLNDPEVRDFCSRILGRKCLKCVQNYSNTYLLCCSEKNLHDSALLAII